MDFCYNLSGLFLLDRLMLAISFLGDGVFIPVLLTIFAAGIFFILKKKHFAWAILLAPLLGNIVKSLLKNLVARPRPGWEKCKSLVSLTDYSFPSGHTIFYTIFFGLLFWYGYNFLKNRWSGKFLCVISGIMIASIGLSRIYLGVHWITDVLAGYVIGGIILAGTIYLLNKYPDPKS